MHKIIKKSLSYLLVLIMVITITPFTSRTNVLAEDLTYTDNDGNVWQYMIDNSMGIAVSGDTYAVKPYKSDTVKGDVTIPSTINGKNVTSFSGLSSCTLVTSVTIPNTIVNISSMAFWGWSSLHTVNFESGSQVKVIQRYAFGNCDKLTDITIPASVQEIGVLYTNPEKLTGFYIFGGCKSLVNIQVEAGSTNFKSVDGVLYSLDGTTLYTYPPAKLGTSYVIPADVTTVNEEAFDTCLNLTEISFEPESKLTTLGNYAFGHSRFITSISGIPDTAVNFGNWVFGDTGWLKTKITDDHPYLVINGVLLNAYYGLTVPANITLPSDTTIINDQIFSNANFSENVYVNVAIPNSVTMIGKNAFYGCTNISTLKIPESVTTIKDTAFAYMSALKSIAIPNSVTSIGESIISNDTSLDYIYTDNDLIKTSPLHNTWTTFHYTFEPFDNYGKEALNGEVSITGNAKYGQTLSAVVNNISNSNPGTIAYKWYRVSGGNETEVSNTGSTYTVTADDINCQLKLKVSSANYSGALEAMTDIVQKADCPLINVPVSGTVNNNGTNKTFTFTGVSGVTYEYSLDNGSSWNDVPELTGTTGTIAIGNNAVEIGKLQVRAKATSLYKESLSISNNSPFTASLEGSVEISGTPKYNQVLIAHVTDCQSNAELVYDWYRSGSSTPIKTGSSNEYTITAADIGKTISVKVSAGGYTGKLEDTVDSAVSKADAIISIATDKETYHKTYGDEDFYLEGITNNVNGTTTYKCSDPGLVIAADGKVHINTAITGKYVVEIGLAETDYYHAAESKYISITVGKASAVTLSLSNLNQTSNAIQAPKVTMVPYSKASYDKIKTEYGVISGSAIVWSKELPSTEGTYKIRATLLKDEANLDQNLEISIDTTTGEQDFIITKYIAPGGGSNGNPSNPSNGSGTGSTTVKNNDGSTTQTDIVKNADGSVSTTVSTIKPDGSKTVKENTSATTKNADGSSKTTENIKETITAADGTTSVITTTAITTKKADGSSTQQSIIALDSSTATAEKSIKTDKDGNIISSIATITPGTSEVSKTNGKAVVTVDMPLSILNAVADIENPTNVSIKITSDITKTALTDKGTKAVTLTIKVPSIENVTVDGAYLSKDVASLAAGNKKDLELNFVNGNAADYTVKISADALGKLNKDMNLALNVSSYNELAKIDTKFAATLKGALKTDTEVQIVSFSDNKALGAAMTLSYDLPHVENISAGDKVYIYRYNSKTNKLEEVANNAVIVGKDGTVTTSTVNGGDFVVSTDKLTGSKITTLVDKVSVNTTVTTMKTGNTTNMKVSLPADIQKVTSFNKKTNPAGQEEAQVIYKVSDDSIAQIDSKGNVTAMKPGKVDITVTVQLESGKKKIIKKTIEIK